MASTLDAPPSQDAYTKVGARLTYRPPTENWRVTLFGNNITDEEIYEFCGTSRGVYVYRHARPANWGVEFSETGATDEFVLRKRAS
jgi:outer membrane receptor protein involved in Fe transport